MAAESFAPAKINLSLHVIGQRDDGYHLLDSIVAFAGIGDWVRAVPAEQLSLNITGARGDQVPEGDDNLVLRAARLIGVNAALDLEKNLPTAAGIGGGSSDAAATLFALADLSGQPVPYDRASELGADVRVCLRGTRTRMRGIGDELDPAPLMPRLPTVLVNPGVGLSTPEVFSALTRKDNLGIGVLPDTFNTVQDAANWLSQLRNDLEAPAISRISVIAEVLHDIGDCDDCLLARMSGSGATCFGIYPDEGAAQRAAQRIEKAHPDWWVVATTLS